MIVTSKPLLVAHIIESFGGGTIHFVRQLTEGLPQHKHVIIHGERAEEINPEVVKARFSNGNGAYLVRFYDWVGVTRELSIWSDFKALLNLIKLLLMLRPDVVHLHSSKAGFLGRLAAKFCGLQRVIYTPNAVSFVRQDIGEVKRWLFILLEQIAEGFGGVIVACSPSEKSAFLDQGIEAYSINNGTAIPDNLEEKKSFSSNFHFSEAFPMVVVNSGRVTRQKNPTFFNAIASGFKERKDICFVWLGDGDLASELTSSNIEITGWKSIDGVAQILGQAHVYLSTSDWEGLPYSGLEAMVAVLPMVVHRAVGNVDLVFAKQNGVIFNDIAQAKKALESYLASPNLCISQALASASLVRKHYNIKDCVAAYNKLYNW